MHPTPQTHQRRTETLRIVGSAYIAGMNKVIGFHREGLQVARTGEKFTYWLSDSANRQLTTVLHATCRHPEGKEGKFTV